MPLGYGQFGITNDPNDELKKAFLELVSKGTVGSKSVGAPQYGSVEAARLPAAANLLAGPRNAVAGYGPGDVMAGPSAVESLIGRGGGGAGGVSTTPSVASPASSVFGASSGPSSGVRPMTSGGPGQPPRSIIEALLAALGGASGPVGPAGSPANPSLTMAQPGSNLDEPLA